jgi:hypothetical protein
MIFSLKERSSKLLAELNQFWIDEVYNFVKLIVLGIDETLVVKKNGDHDGFTNVLHVVQPIDGADEPRHLVGIVFFDESNDSVLIELSKDCKYIIPLQKEDFAARIRSIINEKKVEVLLDNMVSDIKAADRK